MAVGTFFGASPTAAVEDITASRTLKVDESGTTFMWNVVTGATATLPAISGAKGVSYRFIVKTAATSNSYIITENTASDTNKIVSKIAEAEVDTGTDGLYDAGHTTITLGTTAVIGDVIEVFCDGVKWFATGYINADGACVLA